MTNSFLIDLRGNTDRSRNKEIQSTQNSVQILEFFTYDALYPNRNVSGCRKSTEKWNTTLNVYAVARYTLMSTNPVNYYDYNAVVNV